MGADRQVCIRAMIKKRCGADLSNTVGRWLKQEVMPNESNTNRLLDHFPEIAAWLKPDLSHPLRRLLCALDVLGSANNSLVRGLGLTEKSYSVGGLINALKEEWGLLPIVDEPCTIYGHAIPKLRREIPHNLVDLYQNTSPLSVLNIILVSGIIFDDLTFMEVEHWAIDLATVAIVVFAHLESFPANHQFLSGPISLTTRQIYNHYFENSGEEVISNILQGQLEKTIENIKYQKRARGMLILAKKILADKFKAVGLSLNMVKDIFSNIPDENSPWSEEIQRQASHFPRSNLYSPRRHLQPAYPGRFKYILQNTSDEVKDVLCHDLWRNQVFPLLARHDLHTFHTKTKFDWGRPSSGSELLAKSVLAHHFGHDKFGQKEVNSILRDYIVSTVSRHWVMGPFFLTTDMLDYYLNHAEECLPDAT